VNDVLLVHSILAYYVAIYGPLDIRADQYEVAMHDHKDHFLFLDKTGDRFTAKFVTVSDLVESAKK
jgi:hypothetical protein